MNDQWVIEEVRKDIKKLIDSNENKNTVYQKLRDVMKAVLRGKFIAMNIHIRKLDLK
jgi:hypothetical protein